MARKIPRISRRFRLDLTLAYGPGLKIPLVKSERLEEIMSFFRRMFFGQYRVVDVSIKGDLKELRANLVQDIFEKSKGKLRLRFDLPPSRLQRECLRKAFEMPLFPATHPI